MCPIFSPWIHPALSHYVIVPGNIESQPVEWDTLLRKTQLPDRFRSGQQLDPTDLVFRADFNEFRVELQTGQSGFDLPLVRLVDIFLRWQSEDEIHGVATFDLEPNGLEWCPVQLPKKTHMIHARVDGLPARIESDDEGTWHIALGSSILPQRIELIYGQQLDSVDVSHQSLKVHVPQLGKITVLHTLFTIVSPALVGHCTTDDDADAIGAVRQHLFRLKTLSKLMELPTHLLTEETVG